MDAKDCSIYDIKNGNQTSEFDVIIGHIEDIIIDANFNNIVCNFMEKYWMMFENKDENKFIYTDIFYEYTNMLENYISNRLLEKLPSFSMQKFSQELETHKLTLDGEVFEILFTLTDFIKFKEAILDFRNMKEGHFDGMELDLQITGLSNANNV